MRHLSLTAPGGAEIRMTLVNDAAAAAPTGLVAFEPAMAAALPPGELAKA